MNTPFNILDFLDRAEHVYGDRVVICSQPRRGRASPNPRLRPGGSPRTPARGRSAEASFGVGC